MAHDRIPDSHRDLLEAEVATLATMGEDGYPQVSEVWFLVEGDQIAISLNTARQKTKNLQTHPACTLLILDLANPYRYLEIRGRVESIDEDPDNRFINSMAKKYLGEDVYPWPQPGDHRVVVKVHPSHTTTQG